MTTIYLSSTYQDLKAHRMPVFEALLAFACPQEHLIRLRDNRTLDHDSRNDIGRELATLGDSRPGVGAREDATPHIDWVVVPGGRVELEQSSGGKTVLPGISKRGDRYLRDLPVHGARSVVRLAANKDDRLSRWFDKLKARRAMLLRQQVGYTAPLPPIWVAICYPYGRGTPQPRLLALGSQFERNALLTPSDTGYFRVRVVTHLNAKRSSPRSPRGNTKHKSPY